jgi:hypothetical protein
VNRKKIVEEILNTHNPEDVFHGLVVFFDGSKYHLNFIPEEPGNTCTKCGGVCSEDANCQHFLVDCGYYLPPVKCGTCGRWPEDNDYDDDRKFFILEEGREYSEKDLEVALGELQPVTFESGEGIIDDWLLS